MDLNDFIRTAPVLLDFDSADERAALAAVAVQLEGNAAVKDQGKLFTAILDRQSIQPPLLGNGIALPHARTREVKEIVFALGRPATALPFGPEQKDVRLIFLYAAPPEMVAESLKLVAALASRLRRQEVVDGLLAARDEAEFKQWLA